MASLKDVQTKIGGVKKTSQITKAMNMVAAAKLRGAQQKMEDFRPYADQFNSAMTSMSASMETSLFPLMESRETINSVELIVVTSDRGLCGSFNANILKIAEKEMVRLEEEGKTVSFVCIGKKANSYLRKTGKVRKAYLDIMGTFQMFNAREIAQDAAANFLAGDSDEVKLVYGQFLSVAAQRPAMKPLLPIQPVTDDEDSAGADSGDFISVGLGS